MVALVVFINNGYFENYWTQKVHLVVMFSKIWLDLYVMYVLLGRSCMKWYLPIADVQMLYKVDFQELDRFA